MAVSARKYRNVPTELLGIVFESKKEAAMYQDFVLLERAGEISDLSRQVHFPLVVNKMHICTVIVDFTYTEKGRKIIHEAKGKRTLDWVIKWKLAQALYPDWEFRVN